MSFIELKNLQCFTLVQWMDDFELGQESCLVNEKCKAVIQEISVISFMTF